MSFADLFKEISGQESMDVIQVTPVDTVVFSPEEAAIAVHERDEAVTETAIANLTSVVESTANAMEVLTGKVEDLQGAIQGMEKLAVGESEFNSGLFTHHYNTAVKIGNSFGMKMSRQGAESFTNKASAAELGGTEAFKDVAKKASNKVKELFVTLYNGFLDLFDKYIAGYKNLGSRAATMESQLSKQVKELTFPDKVKLPVICGFVDDKGQQTGIPQEVIALANGLKSMGSTSHPDDVMKAVDFATKGILDLGKKSQLGTDEHTDTWKVEVENAHFTLVVPRDAKGISNMALKDIGVDGEGREVSGLSGEQLISLLKEVKTYCGKLEKVDLSRKGLTVIRDNAIARTSAGFQATNVQNLHAGMLKLCKGVSELSGRSIKAQLAFVQAHISQASKKKED